jgi:hypothetical protein
MIGSAELVALIRAPRTGPGCQRGTRSADSGPGRNGTVRQLAWKVRLFNEQVIPSRCGVSRKMTSAPNVSSSVQPPLTASRRVSHLHREAGRPQGADGRVVVSQRCRAWRLPRFQEPDGPGVASQHSPSRVGSLNDLRPPVTVGGRQLYLAEDQIHDAVENLLLVGNVVVERHWLDAEFVGERSHRQGSDSRGVCERDGGPHYSLAAERDALLRRRGGCSWHILALFCTLYDAVLY